MRNSFFSFLVVACAVTAACPQSVSAQSYADELRQIQENANTAQTFALVEELSSSITDPIDYGRFLLGTLDYLSAPGEQVVIAERAGNTFFLAGAYADAKVAFERSIEFDPRNWETVIRLGSVLMEVGETEQAVDTLSAVVQSAGTYRLQRRAARLRTRALMVAGKIPAAVAHSASLAIGDNYSVISPADMFLLWEVSTAANDDTTTQAVAERIAREYPDSPENLLLQHRIGYLPVPSRVFSSYDLPKPVTEQPAVEADETVAVAARTARAVQTGSFRDSENAQYMVRDLESFGFRAHVEAADGGLYRVIVPIAEGENSQETVLHLKERGIEGFLIFASSP